MLQLEKFKLQGMPIRRKYWKQKKLTKFKYVKFVKKINFFFYRNKVSVNKIKKFKLPYKNRCDLGLSSNYSKPNFKKDKASTS